MANKPTKPVHQAKVFTPEQIQEQKRNQAHAMLVQKREQFAVNILCNLVHGAITNKDATNILCHELVDLSVEMADRLLEKLYPIKPKEENE